jgi:uncharacterized protein (TIGR00369 family)
VALGVCGISAGWRIAAIALRTPVNQMAGAASRTACAARAVASGAMPRMTAADIDRFLAEHFAGAHGWARIDELTDDLARVRVPYSDKYLRPGGTMSGPTLMTLADTATYFLVLARVGPEILLVTSSLTIHFLRRPRPADLVAEARLLKLGRRLAVCDVRIFSAGEPDPVAHATVSYAIPGRSV